MSISNITKSFGRLRALDDVTLSISSGQVYGVLGPNGAGKTTLLRILLGLVRPDSGTVSVLGHAPGDRRALRDIGALIEAPAFVPGLSGRTNLRVLARARGLSDTEVDRVLRLVDLAERADDRFAGYSLGMRQRLGVAATLLGDPRLLILDEPTNGLDPEGVVWMRSLVRELSGSGHTVLFSSHMLGEVQQVCDRVVVVNGGTVVAEDSMDNIRTPDVSLHVHAEPDHLVERVLTESAGAGTPVRGEEGRWRTSVAPDEVPRIVRALVEAGADVHEVRKERQSLEEVFFALTGSQEEHP
ncbi:ATP-binding cassette domain-containing protein [Nocardiopsis halotolerans]|uniref:ATP-binding cassette domain-containing protein n=1 Tax=Nocardiopsis halotolerans TaxID=124252 RepID=UPI000373B93E|nr:ATP-binding cassette domain-containing protein [Nocardiopsis halotolerans]